MANIWWLRLCNICNRIHTDAEGCTKPLKDDINNLLATLAAVRARCSLMSDRLNDALTRAEQAEKERDEERSKGNCACMDWSEKHDLLQAQLNDAHLLTEQIASCNMNGLGPCNKCKATMSALRTILSPTPTKVVTEEIVFHLDNCPALWCGKDKGKCTCKRPY